MPDLPGKSALATGATSGIGRAIALGLPHAGATVAVSGDEASLVHGDIPPADGGRAAT